MIKVYRYAIKEKENSPWVFWDGELKSGQEAPFRIKILLTGLEYDWETFEKVRLR